MSSRASAMADKQLSRNLQRSIVAYSAVSTLTISFIVALLAIVPFYGSLAREAEGGLLSELRIRASGLEQFASRVTEIALQVAANPTPEEKPRAHQRQGIGSDRFAASSRRILTEGLRRSKDIRGITRLDSKGSMVAQVGEPLPRGIWTPRQMAGSSVAISGPQTIGAITYLVVGAPIVDANGHRLGTDLVLFDAAELCQILAQSHRPWTTDIAMLAAESRDGLSFQLLRPVGAALHPASSGFPPQVDEGAAERALRHESGIAKPDRGGQWLLAYGPIQGVPWGLVIRMDRSELYAPIYRQLALVGRAILVLIVLGTLGVVLLLRPLAGKLILRADELAQEVQEKTAALQAELNERVSAEEELSRMAAIVESSDDAIIGMGPDGVIHSWNAGAERVYGYPKQEVIGRSLSLLAGPGSPDRMPDTLARIMRGEHIPPFEGVNRRKNGGEIHISTTISPIRDAGDRVVGASAIARDITDRKRTEEALSHALSELQDRESALRQALEEVRQSHEALEETQLQLIQAVKMESVGQLAAGVAHEVKNPLAIIMIGVSYLAHYLPDDPSITMALNDIRDAIRRADVVIGGLLNYSAKRRLELTREDLTAVIDQALLLIKHKPAPHHVTVVRELAAKLPRVQLDKTKMEQVFVNLFLNAIDAMPDGGTLTIRTYTTTLTKVGGQMGNRASDSFQPGETVVVTEVEDTGKGIDRADLDKIFDPFFTTKPTGKGTGLGLAVTKSIIEMHKGSISVKNREEGGVRVSLMFKTDGSGGES